METPLVVHVFKPGYKGQVPLCQRPDPIGTQYQRQVGPYDEENDEVSVAKLYIEAVVSSDKAMALGW
ncbi:hypothetical protein BGZ46_001442 [Entomortierella lignicola]|nr:hypothetical protein BGZ46_001442 [Entomortierella lignicola]